MIFKQRVWAYLSTSEASKFDPGVITAPGVVALLRSCSYIRVSPGTGPPGAVPEALSRGVCGCVCGCGTPTVFCGWWPKTLSGDYCASSKAFSLLRNIINNYLYSTWWRSSWTLVTGTRVVRELAHSESWILVTLAVSSTDAAKIIKPLVKSRLNFHIFAHCWKITKNVSKINNQRIC